MKQIIILIFLVGFSLENQFLPVTTTVSTVNDWQDCPFLMFTYGFLSVSEILQQIPDLGNCVSNITDITQNVEAIINLFEQETVQSIGQAVILLGKTLKNLIDDCGNTYLNTTVVLNELKADLHNETFIIEGLQRVLSHIDVVIQDLDNMQYDYEQGNYFLSGEDVGDVLKIFLNPDTQVIKEFKGIPYPFVDLQEGNDIARVNHVYAEETAKKTLNIRFEGNIMQTLTIKNIKIDFIQGNRLVNTVDYQLEGKKYKSGKPFEIILNELDGSNVSVYILY